MSFNTNNAMNNRRSENSFGANFCCADTANVMDAVVLTASIFVVVIIGVLNVLSLLLAALIIMLPIIIISAENETPVKRCESLCPMAA